MTKKTVIVTEKPSVARTYAKVLGVTEKHDGYMESEKYIITWCVGHLVTLAYPESYDAALKKWEMETLPFLPEEYKYEIIEKVKKQFNVIKKLYNDPRVGAIYYAGDAGREGAYIQALVRQEAGTNKDAIEKIVWIDSQTEDEIKRGLKEAKPYHEYDNMIASGYERAIEDYATGINYSRLLTLKYGELANKAAALEKHKPISVGRVMSCVLGMIIRREREIDNFVPTPFYKINNKIFFHKIGIDGEWKVTPESSMYESHLLYNDNGFKNEEDAIQFMESLPNTVTIQSVEKKIENKSAPLLFNLAELQSECSKKFKIAPDKTLSIAQSLYEKQLTTYPRTDSRALSTAVAKEIERNVSGLLAFPMEEKTFAETILANGWDKQLVKSKYADDSKVTDHYAIIPTGEGLNAFTSLDELEKQVYLLIVKRFLSVFYPPAEYFKVKLIEKAGKETFYSSGRILNKKGYLEVVGLSETDEEKNNKVMAISSIKEGESYECSYEITKGETTPPKRYTSGSIILAMENAGQLIEEEELREQIKGTGIGTSSTRGETIKKLVAQEYISINSKTQVIYSLPLGNIVYEILNMTLPAILNPEMTASWEKGLEQIVNGEISPEKYRRTLENYVRREALRIKDSDLTEEITKRILPYSKTSSLDGNKTSVLESKCPYCGSVLKTTKYGCICENYKTDGDGCTFSIGQIAGVTLSAKELDTLISTGKLAERDGFLSKTRKKFKAGLSLTFERDEAGNIFNRNIEFVFPPKEEPSDSDVKCFKCSSPMKRNKWNYECSCGYKLSHTVAGKALTEETIKTLLKEKKTRVISGFTSRSKKTFKAALKLNENGEIEFDFGEKK